MPYVKTKRPNISDIITPEMFKKEPSLNFAIQTEVSKILTVKVIFRKWKGELIAFFPEIPGDNEWLDNCLSYSHVGQHGSASTRLQKLKPVTPEEFYPLWRELTEIVGYNLIVVERFKHRSDRKARKSAYEKS